MNVHQPLDRLPGSVPAAPPRFKLPARLIADGREAEVLDWSEAHVTFRAPGADLVKGDVLDATLAFPFRAATLRNEIVAEVESFDPRTGLGRLTYDIQSDEAKAPAFVIGEYLAGRITVMDGMLSGSETLRSAPQAAARPAFGAQTIRRAVGLGVIALAGAGALYFLGSAIYDRLFVFDAVSAQVAFETVEAAAPATGTITALAAPGRIDAGSPLFSVVDELGTVTPVESPCNCELLTSRREEGSFVTAGSMVTQLVRADAPGTVEVSVAFPDVRRVYEGAAVDLKFLDGEWVRGARIVRIESLGGQQSSLVRVMVDPGRPLLAVQYGEPVYARFDTAPWR